jgi:hypothetical protein
MFKLGLSLLREFHLWGSHWPSHKHPEECCHSHKVWRQWQANCGWPPCVPNQGVPYHLPWCATIHLQASCSRFAAPHRQFAPQALRLACQLAAKRRPASSCESCACCWPAIPIHAMLATEIPKPISEAIIKCQRNFFWSSGRHDGGGSCAIAWRDVCCPIEMGGLGVLDLKRMSWALRAHWSWL